ncbi:hypothetical protein HOM13_00365 [Candidatus Woesearchaeota archaeon]|jgi:hypothetical protein|nr:hypothetical protein [Candidatus Woesearchaeota archaeon]
MVNEKTVIGFYEDVIIHGKKIRAKVDSGAGVSSIDYDLAKKLKVGPIIGQAAVVNTSGKTFRPVIMLEVEIAGRVIEAKFNIAVRDKLRYPVLIGKNILRQDFIIDSKKKLKKSDKEIIKNTCETQEMD